MDIKDLGTAFGRSLTSARPDARAVTGFFGEEVFASTVGWTAGTVSVWLVDQFFVVRSWRNLWGLTATKRTALPSDTYQLMVDGLGYVVGLMVLIGVRQFVVGTIAHYRALRRERAERGLS